MSEGGRQCERAMIDVMIITYNEALNLPHCLEALQGWTNKVFVVDSGSTDGTQEIAKRFGSEVVRHDWEGYARQKNWGLDTLPFESPWTLIVDADEVITEKLRRRLVQIASKPVDEVPEDGFFVNRLTYFLSKPIRHCGYFPSWNLRFFKRGTGRYEDREVHEHVIMDDLVGYIEEPMIHDDRRGLEHYFAKHNRYSTLEARALFNAMHGRLTRLGATLTAQMRRHRWLKQHISPYLPLASLWRFLYMYVLRLGFLDGLAGLAFCGFISMYERMVVLKLKELRRQAKSGELVPSVAPAAAQGLAVPEGAEPVTPTGFLTAKSPQDTRILGVCAFHGDAAAAGLVNGRVVTCVEEERFTRIKHWAGFPRQAIRHCIEEIAEGDLANVTAVAIARMPRAHFGRKVLVTLLHPRLLPHARNRLRAISRINTLDRMVSDTCAVNPKRVPRLYWVEHHLSHIASSFLCSPFEEAMCLTVDGFGDFVSTMRAVGRGNRIDVIDRVFYPHSLGLFYTAITQYLGFPKYGDEYKMMGLAAYGEPTFAEKLAQLVPALDDGRFKLNQKYFRMVREGVDMTWDDGEPDLGPVFNEALVKLLGQRPRGKDQELTQFHHDLAASAQAVYEQRFFALVRSLQRMTGLKKLALAGGCALNSLANGRLLEQSDLEEIFIQPAAGDSGTSLGAALFVHHSIMGHPRQFVMEHSNWGPRFEASDRRAAIAAGIPESGGRDGTWGEVIVETIQDDDLLCDQIAAALDRGEVVGWYQGRCEWGPRALGNRSILADPRRADMRDLLNLKIKRRESFRPFAPSILQERVGDWFTINYPDPFMLKVYPIKPQKRSQIPAVTHVDGTGRLQTVSKASNPRYYKLISAFEKRTGVPMVLNTSFNENEPIVNTPAEALDCFLRTKMDCLVLEDVVIRRTQSNG